MFGRCFDGATFYTVTKTIHYYVFSFFRTVAVTLKLVWKDIYFEKCYKTK